MRDTLTMIPLTALRASKQNVRKTDRTADVEALAASIEAHGLLQNLTVRETGQGAAQAYEVVAGGRRLAALKYLVKRKRLDKETAVPCRVLTDEDPAGAEVSLVENVLRVPLHPADQFEAFSKLQADGLGPEEIAARFGISAAVVQQRLRLAAVSPRLIAAYRDDEMTLDQLMAFTLSDDREAQEAVWDADPRRERSPHVIRRALTSELVDGTDRRARFVGAEAYEAAGGTIVRDLFRPDDEGYFADIALLERLTSEKLADAARTVEQEGWQWVESRPEMDYEYLGRFGRVPPDIEESSDEEKTRLDELCARYDKLVEELEADPSEEDVQTLDALEAEIEALSAPRERWDDEAKARGGAFVALGYDGDLVVVRGLLSPQAADADTAERPDKKTRERGTKANGGVSDGLREVLSAHRTAALRVELGRKPEVAFLALLHALVLRTFHGPMAATCVDIRPQVVELGTIDETLRESESVKLLTERHAEIAGELPEADGLWTWLAERSFEANLALLAHCTARCVDALWHRHGFGQEDRLAQADLVAGAVGLDMAAWWQPTRTSFLDHVTKNAILSAVSEGVSSQAAENIGKLKKGAMAARAEELLAGTGWLPAPLRSDRSLPAADG